MEFVKDITITEKLVNDYANLIGDYNPIHLDKEYAKTTIFKDRIAHGLLVSSFISSIIANDYPGKGSIYLSQNLKFIKPCYLGDTLTYVVKLNKKVDSKFYLTTNVYKSNKLILEGSALILNKNIL